ncbi:MAG: 3'(2'),5'-bisphosphate nucleotidase CysQ [Alphaproteobacteria bacterium]
MAEAGAIARTYFRNEPRQWQKGPGQVVTEADIAIDRHLHDRLIGARPDDAWLSEERDDDGSRHRHRRLWIVDPIDGTRSFAKGVGEFTISVGLVIDGEPVLGAVLNPITSEHFEAAAGLGATLNGAPLRPQGEMPVDEASLLVSSGEMKKRHFDQILPEAAFTSIGSLAYKLALVAAGRFAGLISLRSCHDWDIAAAVLLLREAGARIGDAQGDRLQLNKLRPTHRGLVAAGSEGLYKSLLNRLATIGSAPVRSG